MYRLKNHIVIGPKSVWCGNKRAGIVTIRNIGEAPVKSCGGCGQVAEKF